MAKSNSIDYYGSLTDNDSGIGYDLDYSSSNDLNSSTSTLIEPSSSYISQSRISSPYISQPRILSPLPPPPVSLPSTTTIKQRLDAAPLIKFASDGVVERTRPSTMRNSENGDFVLCQTNRGAYVAYRTPVVPQWVTRLVQEVESRQQ